MTYDTLGNRTSQTTSESGADGEWGTADDVLVQLVEYNPAN